LLNNVHPEIADFWMELSAVSDQQSANILFLVSFPESRKLMADSAPVLRSPSSAVAATEGGLPAKEDGSPKT